MSTFFRVASSTVSTSGTSATDILNSTSGVPMFSYDGTKGVVMATEVELRIDNTSGTQNITTVSLLWANDSAATNWAIDTALQSAIGAVNTGSVSLIKSPVNGRYLRVQVTSAVGSNSFVWDITADNDGLCTIPTVNGTPVSTTAVTALTGNVTGTYSLVGTPTLGSSSVVPACPGGLTIGAGKAVTGGTGALTVDTTGALNLGTALATSVSISAACVGSTVNGKLTLSQGLVLARRAPTSAASVTGLVTDQVIDITPFAGGTTITLPVSVAGQQYIVQDFTGGAAAANITIAISGGSIHGTATITANYGRRIVICDGTNAVSL